MTGPDTGGPPSGPKFRLALPSRLRDVLLGERIRREASASQAGAKGVSAVPLSTEQRQDRYRRQTGSERRTPRQRRRAEHKARHAAVCLPAA